ncbi:MAG: polysaccharide deacetylase family protein [Eubacterium sp.]|nr:polysaccharide deacetylase family protein [Eubacterium sp.]
MKKRRYLSLLCLLVILCIGTKTKVLGKSYSKYSNRKVEFGLNLRRDHKKPECAKPKGVKKLSNYNTWYYSPEAYKQKDKVIYLTFDCGYENGNTKKILKTLKKENIKAIFFVTKPYIEQNAGLVKRMKEEGHLVGNHTSTHPRMTSLSVSRMKKEVNQCRKTMEKKTGYTMDPYMRPPEGVYSVRVMKVMQDCGYNTMLWSLAWYDYDEHNQPSVSTVVNKFKKHHFCGMMPLLHVISSADRKALPKIISTMRKKGYRFGTVDEFAILN